MQYTVVKLSNGIFVHCDVEVDIIKLTHDTVEDKQ